MTNTCSGVEWCCSRDRQGMLRCGRGGAYLTHFASPCWGWSMRLRSIYLDGSAARLLVPRVWSQTPAHVQQNVYEKVKEERPGKITSESCCLTYSALHLAIQCYCFVKCLKHISELSSPVTTGRAIVSEKDILIESFILKTIMSYLKPCAYMMPLSDELLTVTIRIITTTD